ncbi:MAG: hypothetical protein C4548_03940 [Desulfobacteraceae bacterium]|jgi:hypothetical protein|nr:MAG: hypothetical protein C4548_03940 [Desulfobacteraceae bacterium]
MARPSGSLLLQSRDIEVILVSNSIYAQIVQGIKDPAFLPSWITGELVWGGEPGSIDAIIDANFFS